MNSSKYLFNLLIIIILITTNKALSQVNLNKQVVNNTVIAHRGMPRHAPEETAPSYWLAKKLGADYLEADLQRTKDGIIICLHDDNLTRTTNIESVFPKRAHLPVSEFTLKELRQLDVGSWFNHANHDIARESYVGLSILTLEELIEIAEANNTTTGLYLETKKPELFPNIEKELFELLDKKGWVESPDKKLILQTFSNTSLTLLNKYFPNTPKCMLLWNNEEFLLGGVTKAKLQNALDFGRNNGATIVGPSFTGEMNNYFNLMEDWMVEMYHNMDYIIHPYTFDVPSDFEYAPKSDGQFTNRSDLMMDYHQRDHKSIDAILLDLNY